MDFDSMMDEQNAMDKVMAAKKDGAMDAGMAEKKEEVSPEIMKQAQVHVDALNALAAKAGCEVEDFFGGDMDQEEDEKEEGEEGENAADDSMDMPAPSMDPSKDKKKILIIEALKMKKKKGA